MSPQIQSHETAFSVHPQLAQVKATYKVFSETDMSRLMTKSTKWLHPAKARISLVNG